MQCRLLQALCVSTALFGAGAAKAQEVNESRPEGAAPHSAETPEEPAALEPTEDAKKEAAERFQRGLSFYEDGDYGLALIEFERAYQLVPDYRVLYNIGQVSIQLSRSSQALRALREYLKAGGDALDADRIAAVERDLDMLHARTAHLSLTGTEGAEIVIDDDSYGTFPLLDPLLLDAGRHKIEVRKEGFRTFSDRFTLAGAEERQLSVQLEPNAIETPLKAPPPSLEPEPRPPTTSAPVDSAGGAPWALLGWSATGALAGGAILSGVLGLGAAKKLRDAKSEPDAERSDLDRHAKTAKTSFLVADILTATAVATGGATLYISLRGDSREERARLRFREQPSLGWLVGLSPSAVSVSRRF